jgi:ATP-dependent DNA ligase
MKAEEECDLKVIGMEEGTGKYDGVLGALVCETADGLLKVNVGTGFSDDDRIDYWDSNIRNVIVTVRYNQKIKDKKTGVHSLFLPRFVCVREDKDVANTLEEIK